MRMDTRAFAEGTSWFVDSVSLGASIPSIETEGFTILGLKKIGLSQRQAEAFYEVHRERPFYRDLCKYMVSGPVYVAALQRENAVAHLRKVMGATDPKKADRGTIRADFGESIEQNAIHGSDSDDNARIEINFFFAESELTV